MATTLTDRWHPLHYHPVQASLWSSESRFRVVPAGRRSGKTEIAKRFLVRKALTFNAADNGRFLATAPTQDQAKEIFWDDLVRLTPKWARLTPDRISPIPTITLVNGARIQVVGLDKPSRAEGRPIDGIVLDEYADMRPDVWDKHIRAGLDTVDRPGWALFIGVPEGRNHYYTLYERATEDLTDEWAAFTWISADILTEKQIADAKRDLDELTYKQEYEASFDVSIDRIYHEFNRALHVTKEYDYDASLPIVFCLDFNREPGVALICQEQGDKTIIFDEVWIRRNSLTKHVANRLVKDWKFHRKEVIVDGDATGGAVKTSGDGRSDWDIVEDILRPVFKHRMHMCQNKNKQNPPVDDSIRSVNARLRTADGAVHMFVHPRCKHTIRDFEGVQPVPGTMYEIEKDKDSTLTHLSDAFRYYCHRAHPSRGRRAGQLQIG